MTDLCLYCRIDAHNVPEVEKHCAYYACGVAGEFSPPPCSMHARAMALGAAALGEVCGSDPAVTNMLRAGVAADAKENLQ